MAARYLPGARVKMSGHALESSRLYWLGLGDYTRKQRAKDDYDSKQARRGTIIERDVNYCTAPSGVSVQWDDGRVSHCLDYMVECA